MNIQKTVDILLANTEEIRRAYPSVSGIRHEIKDIPLDDLKEFARKHKKTLTIDSRQNRMYVLYSPWNHDRLDTDIWLYSKPLIIKPAEYSE